MNKIYPTKSAQAGGGGSAILNAWRAEREQQRTVATRAGKWSGAGGPSKVLRAPPNSSLARYMGAANDRLVADMADSLGVLSGNADIRQSLRRLRSRSRKLAKDNEYAKRFFHLLRNNVVGAKGINLQMKVYKARGALDKDANLTIEQAYAKHCKLGMFTADGKMSRRMFERTAVTCLARDGEVIVEKLIGREFGPFGLAWQLIDPMLLDDEVNVGANGAMPGYGQLDEGNSIRMGVEVNKYMRPVAYWFLTAHPGDDVMGVPLARHRRVLADRILHYFMPDELLPGSTRGVPWLYAALRRMAMLGGYEEAALVNARQGASKMGFYKPPADEMGRPPDASKLADNGDDDEEEDSDPNRDLYTEAEPGVFSVLPAGWDFQTYDPKYPNEATEGFVKLMLMAFGAGVGLTYSTVTGDLSKVNLSTMRQGGLDDRDTYEAIQNSVIEGLSVPMFESWLSLSLDLGQVGRLPPSAFDRLNQPRFIARPWRSPDPQKDRSAQAQGVALGVTSRTRICEEAGEDFEEILEELAEEEAMAKAMGVTLNTQAATAHKNPPPQTSAGGGDDTTGSGDPEDSGTNTKPNEGEDEDA